MALFRRVDGVRVQLTPQEEAARRVEEAATNARGKTKAPATLADVWAALKSKGTVADSDLPAGKLPPS